MDTVKKVLKFSGIISAVVAVVAFILMMACPAVKYTLSAGGSSNASTVAGTTAIFGGTDSDYAVTWAGLTSFILVVVALIILIAGIVLPIVKVTALDKFAGILNLVAVVALICAGVFCFCIVAAWKSANGDGSFSALGATGTYSICAGWVIAGILYIVAGAVAIAPAVVDFIDKK